MSQAKLSLKSYQPFGDSHQHDFHQLVLPVNGSLDMEIGTKAGEVTDHQAAIICASETHAFEAKGFNQFVVADIPVQLAPSFSSLPIFVSLDDNIRKYIDFLQSQLSLEPTQQNTLIQRQMLLLLVQLLDDQHASTKLFDKRILQARHFLERHFRDKHVINDASRYSHLSERHLRQLFAKYYDMSPSQYVLELRMQCAWQLLQTSNKNIQMIAEQCGYSNASAFSDRFHKHFSATPVQVRRLSK